MPITIPLTDEQTRKVSDGYHTFDELYEHRCALFILLALRDPDSARWKPHFEGWPILFLELPGAGQISYHFPEKWLPLIEGKIVRDDNYYWDKHTSDDVLKRLTLAVTYQ